MDAFLVTTATGKTGNAVARQLLERGERVRAVVHRLDRRSADLAALGAEIVVADLFDVDDMRAAMRGTKRAYFTLPVHPHALQAGVAFAVAAHEARLEAIVGMTQWLASPDHPAAHTRHSWLTDRLFALVPGAAHVVVNPGYFADSYLFTQPLRLAVHLGLFPNPYGAGKNAPPSNEDIARVAVACLLDPETHAGRTYHPTGPELLDGRQMASVLSRIFDIPIRSVDLPFWMFAKAMRATGLDPFFQTNVRHYVAEHKAGAFSIGAPTDHVERLTGRPAESFETIAYRYAAHPSLRPTLRNRVATLAEFVSLGLIPAFDLDRYERRTEIVRPKRSRLAVTSERWLAERRAIVERPVATSGKSAASSAA